MAKTIFVLESIQWAEGVVTSAAFSSAAADVLDADKQEHLYHIGSNFGLDHDATPADVTRVVWIATTAGVVRKFKAGMYDTGTSSSVAFDLLKNGVSVLSAVVTVTHADADRALVEGTINTTTFVAGDWFTIDCNQTTTTGATGAHAFAIVQETAE